MTIYPKYILIVPLLIHFKKYAHVSNLLEVIINALQILTVLVDNLCFNVRMAYVLRRDPIQVNADFCFSRLL